MSDRKLYTVAWVIEVFADTPEEAAREALAWRDDRDEDRIDNQFYVTEDNVAPLLLENFESVDLDVIDDRI